MAKAYRGDVLHKKHCNCNNGEARWSSTSAATTFMAIKLIQDLEPLHNFATSFTGSVELGIGLVKVKG